MSFSSFERSLSSLVPVKLNYNYNTEEKLDYVIKEYTNKLSFNKYSAFDNIQDLSFSDNNALFLTGVKPLSSIFDSTSTGLKIGEIAGTFFLKTATPTKYLQYTGNEIQVVSPSFNKLTVTVVPVGSNKVELHTNNNTSIQILPNYPYTAYTSNAILSPLQKYRQQFEVEFSNNLISFKTSTKEGDRYLSYGNDGILRAVGLMLNNTIINSYLFIPEFITKSNLTIGFDPTTNEVKYYNDLESFKNRTTVDIKDKTVAETNVLISCATNDMTKPRDTNINIALLRTNYTSTGTYAPTHQASVLPSPVVLNYLAIERDGITPVDVEDTYNVGPLNHEGFSIYI